MSSTRALDAQKSGHELRLTRSISNGTQREDLTDLVREGSRVQLRDGSTSTEVNSQTPAMTSDGVVYKVYKRRWFGLIQLILLNIIVSWDV